MEKQIIYSIILILGLIGTAYFLLRKKNKEISICDEILNNKEFQVKGQWEK